MNKQNILFVEGNGIKLKIDGINMGAVRTNHPKISQLTLAAIVEREFPEARVDFIDLKSADPTREERIKEVRYGDKTIEVYKVGQDFHDIEQDIASSDTIVLTNNFTQEAGILGDLIGFCKQVKPSIKVLVGGSDASVNRNGVNRQAYFYSRGADKVAPLGDGEIILPRLLQNKNADEANKILISFDSVPDPAFHLADLSIYTESHEGPLPKGISAPLMYLETSRGCKNSCNFCSTPFTKGKYRYMGQSRIKEILGYYKNAGINTLLLCEDNLLSRLDFPGGRAEVIGWFNHMWEKGFAWEFSNGVEIGKLADDEGVIDEELVKILFGFDGSTGCYRSYIPLERVDDSSKYRKLKPFDIEKRILTSIVEQGAPLLNLGVIIGHPQETMDSLDLTERRMQELMGQISEQSEGKTKPYTNIFLHIPISGTNDCAKFIREGRLAFDINDNPELYNFYTSVINGDNLSCYDLTMLRRDIAFRLNGEEAMGAWEHTGKYEYSRGR